MTVEPDTCGCPAHNALVACDGCDCGHAGDRRHQIGDICGDIATKFNAAGIEGEGWDRVGIIAERCHERCGWQPSHLLGGWHVALSEMTVTVRRRGEVNP